ncbi:hypothetical protein [Algiphilus sp.]|uniref:hypothetical protein n=1 Tax=Algiphilus sp. TaxID=1872431 RepID=UPI003B5275D9
MPKMHPLVVSAIAAIAFSTAHAQQGDDPLDGLEADVMDQAEGDVAGGDAQIEMDAETDVTVDGAEEASTTGNDNNGEALAEAAEEEATSEAEGTGNDADADVDAEAEATADAEFGLPEQASDRAVEASREGLNRAQQARENGAAFGRDQAEAAQARRPDETGRPDSSGRPDEAARPDDTDRPDEAGRPDQAERPAETQRPDDTGRPDSTSRPGDADRPEQAGRPADR